MCGFAGYFSQAGVSEEICQSMLEPIKHRGPDDDGVWLDQDVGIALGHKRLSIQDLSPLGHQPMLSSSGRYVIAYNGEVYNFQALQKELEGDGVSFRGHSDTEVLLAAIEVWGIEDSVKRFAGMFAFALWDQRDQILTLARDRLGEKPLYYGWQNKSLLFASELKALKVHPAWVGEINRDALALYMRHNYIPAPCSIYQDVYKLMPGCLIQVKKGELQDPVAYWQAKHVAEKGARSPLNLSDKQAISALDELLSETIKEKMISDVPLGSFLSGGIDSSAVVALMQQQTEQKVKTFTIGFHEQGYNEAEHAKAVAKHLGTEHTEMYVTAQQAMSVIPKLPTLYDEPFADSSQIPTYLVSAMTKQHVTVALSGDGGDELFAGYGRYFLCQSLWRKLSLAPLPCRSMLSLGITALSTETWDRLGSPLGLIAPVLQNRLGDRLHKLAGVLGAKSRELMYQSMVSNWQSPSSVVLGSQEPLTALTNASRWATLDDYIQWMQFVDTISYLPDDILTKVDRAGMGVSLETRVPFLDHRVVEFSWRIPMHQKIRNGEGKWLLRQVLYQYVPKGLIDRPKMGFGVPIDQWLRTSLRDWAENLLDEARLQQEGFFDALQVRKKWDEHLSGKRNWKSLLWNVLMFQAWLDAQKSG